MSVRARRSMNLADSGSAQRAMSSGQADERVGRVAKSRKTNKSVSCCCPIRVSPPVFTMNFSRQTQNIAPPPDDEQRSEPIGRDGEIAISLAHGKNIANITIIIGISMSALSVWAKLRQPVASAHCCRMPSAHLRRPANSLAPIAENASRRFGLNNSLPVRGEQSHRNN